MVSFCEAQRVERFGRLPLVLLLCMCARRACLVYKLSSWLMTLVSQFATDGWDSILIVWDNNGSVQPPNNEDKG